MLEGCWSVQSCSMPLPLTLTLSPRVAFVEGERTRGEGIRGACINRERIICADLSPPPGAHGKVAFASGLGAVPQLGIGLGLRSGGRVLDNRRAGHTNRGASVGIPSAAVGRLKPSFSAQVQGASDAPSFYRKPSSGDAAGIDVLGVGNRE
jgi:hypothetical protein